MAPLILSPRQRAELEYLASHDPVAKQRCRAQALLWLDEGETAEQVAESLRISRRTVYYWLERFHYVSGLESQLVQKIDRDLRRHQADEQAEHRLRSEGSTL